MNKVKLKPFAKVDDLEVEVAWQVPGKNKNNLKLVYLISGRTESLKVPELSLSPSRIEGLYHHTCFELFISLGDRYLEWNFSPSGDWCTFVFDSYRKPALSPEDLKLEPIQFSVSHLDQKLILEVEIPLGARLFENKRPTQMGFSAVLETNIPTLSYWAIKHPSKKPDFHLSDNWCINNF